MKQASLSMSCRFNYDFFSFFSIERRSADSQTPQQFFGGHAIVGSLLPHHDPVNKVTVIPRGQAKGLTWFTPGEDQSLISAAMLKAVFFS